MFFLGSGSSILPYLLSLILIWGVLLLNGILDTTLKREIKKNAGAIYEVKNTSPSLNKNSFNYEDQTKTIRHSVKNSDLLHDCLQSVFNPKKFHLRHITYNFFQSVSCSFLRRGPPNCIFTSQV